MNLTILHTNDLHGHVDELAVLTAMARRIRREVEAAGGHCLLVDCGDAEERSVLEMAVTRGRAAAVCLRAAGYDLAVVGNGAPLSYGPQVVADMADAFGQPLLAGNLLDGTGALIAGCTPWVVRTVGGVTVGFVGMAPRWEHWTWFGLQNPESAPIVRTGIKQVRQAGATVIVLLSHLGIVDDLQLTLSVRGIDLIVGGHSHSTIYGGLIQMGVLLAQAGDYGRFLGRVDLVIDDHTHRVTGKRATLLPLAADTPPDPELLAAWRGQQAIVRELLQEPVGETVAAVDLDPLGESALGSLLADGLRERTGADTAIVQPTSLLAGLPAGVVTLGDMYAACMSPGNPTVRDLTGAQLREMLELGLDPIRAKETAPWGRGRANGRLAVSGLTAVYAESAPAGQRLSEVRVGGETLDPARTYRVAGSDAEMTNLAWRDGEGRSLLSFELGDDVTYEVPTTLRDVLEDYVRQHSPITPPLPGRIVLTR
ncbi:MAG: bifunctional UDP-sugar hydrolase/5'-nucleotidase [Caldilineales bacterium]